MHVCVIGGYSREHMRSVRIIRLLTAVWLYGSIAVNSVNAIEEKNERVSIFVCNLKVTEVGLSLCFCLSLSLSLRGGLHYPGQSSAERSGGPRLVECRNAPAICCTLELDLQPNSISSPSQCH